MWILSYDYTSLNSTSPWSAVPNPISSVHFFAMHCSLMQSLSMLGYYPSASRPCAHSHLLPKSRLHLHHPSDLRQYLAQLMLYSLVFLQSSRLPQAMTFACPSTHECCGLIFAHWLMMAKIVDLKVSLSLRTSGQMDEHAYHQYRLLYCIFLPLSNLPQTCRRAGGLVKAAMRFLLVLVSSRTSYPDTHQAMRTDKRAARQHHRPSGLARRRRLPRSYKPKLSKPELCRLTLASRVSRLYRLPNFSQIPGILV